MAESAQDDIQGAEIYFPDEGFRFDDDDLTFVRSMEFFFTEYSKLKIPQGQPTVFESDFLQRGPTLMKNHCVSISIQILMAKFREFRKIHPQLPVIDFQDAIHNEPQKSLKFIALALHQIVFKKEEVGFRINVRISDWAQTTTLKNLKSNYVERFVQIKGNVIRVSSIKPLVKSMEFTCKGCNHERRHNLVDGFYSVPSGCPNPKCKRPNYKEKRDTVETLDWQKLRIQEIMAVDDLDNGRIPRTIDVEITEDLVDCCIPGDVVTCTGVVKAIKSEVSGKDRNRVVYVLYIQANNIIKQHDGEDDESGCEKISCAVNFTQKTLQFIAIAAQEPELFKLLVHSICPSIYGHELVKAGLLLTLVGGVRRQIDGTRNVYIRGDPHMLIVGDPGLGKSQMLRRAAQIAPRGVYVCGNTTTTAGLTVTMIRDGGDTAMEAGALVLGDQGVCCLDELDKMASGATNALLEAMEQQSISVAKAGMVCTLSARTSVLAAANPVGGHYDKAKTVNENLKISSVLLSRFDLTFILIDKPDESRDEQLCRHIFNLHHQEGKEMRKHRQILSNTSSLLSRLRMDDSEFDALPPELLRKYIAYAKRYVRPRLSHEARAVLQEFYLNLRKNYSSTECTPITTRQLESMIRLSQARARIELREIVTKQDAEDVVELMKESLYDQFEDEFGTVDFTRSSGCSKKKELTCLVNNLKRWKKSNKRDVISEAELKDVISRTTDRPDYDYFISALHSNSFILQKPNKNYKIAL